jgi:hypothetical protein
MASPADFNQADVAAAVSLYLGVGVNRPEVRAIASRISLQGIRIPPGGSLSQSGDFHSRVLAVGGSDLAQLVDANRMAQLIRENREQANVTSAEGALHHRHHHLPLAWRGRGDGDDSSGGSSRYSSEMPGDIGSITAHNYTHTPYHGMGIPWDSFAALRSEGFSGQHIMNAARDANALGFRGDRSAIRDHAIIDKHSIDARGMNRSLQDYQHREDEDSALSNLIVRRERARTEEERRALDEQIAARRLEHERASGLHDRLDDPREDRRATEAARRRREAIDKQHESHLGVSPRLTGEEEARAFRRLSAEDRRRLEQAQAAEAVAGLAQTRTAAAAEADDVLGGAAPPSPTVVATITPPRPPPPAQPPAKPNP